MKRWVVLILLLAFYSAESAAPGAYRVAFSKIVNGVETPLGEPQTFQAVPLATATLPAQDRKALLVFEQKTQRLQRAVLGAVETAKEAKNRLDHLLKALDDTPAVDPKLKDQARALTMQLMDLQKVLNGDPVIKKYNEPVPPSIVDRVQGIVYGHWTTTTESTGTHQRSYEIAAAEFAGLLQKLQALVETDLRELENNAEQAGAPWTPGRVPRWNPE